MLRVRLCRDFCSKMFILSQQLLFKLDYLKNGDNSVNAEFLIASENFAMDMFRPVVLVLDGELALRNNPYGILDFKAYCILII